MKYAYIALIAFYLVTLTITSDKAEKGQESHGAAPEAAIETPHQEDTAPAIAAAAHQQEPAEQAHAEQPKGADTEHQAAVTEEPAAEEGASAGQWEAIAKSAGVTVEGLMEADSQPGEKEAAQKSQDQPAEEKPAEVAAAAPAEQPKAAEVASSEKVQMPCGHMMARKDMPANGPCGNMMPKGAAEGEQDLSAAMQKIVDATNEMVMVTRQLVFATQEMLNASRQAAVETAEKAGQEESQPVKQ